MNAEIFGDLSPKLQKKYITYESTEFCYCCCSKSDSLDFHVLKTSELIKAFEVRVLMVCYVCKQLAQQTEQFIEKVQNNRCFYILDEDDDEDLRGPYDPLKFLERCRLPSIDFQPVDVGQSFEQNAVSLRNADFFQVKKEVAESTDDDDVQFVQSYNNDEQQLFRHEGESYGNDEQQLFRHEGESYGNDEQQLFRHEGESYGNDEQQLVHEEEIIVDDTDNDDVDKCDDADDVDVEAPDKSSNGDQMTEAQAQHKIKKLLAGKIKKIYICKKQCKEERDKKARKPSYVAARHKCTLCIQTMSTWIKLCNHMDKFHSLFCGPFECNVCRRRKYTATELKSHRMSHFKRYKCVECGALTSTCVAAKAHFLKEHANIDLYSCNLCKRPFASKNRFRLHMRRHATDEKLMCKYCNTYPRCPEVHLKCCRKREEIKRKRLLSKTNPFYCAVCDRNFVTHAGFNRHSNSNIHLKKLNGKSCTKFKCDYCGREYNEKGFLRNHIFNLHMNMYKLPCKYCPKKFYCHFTLGRHVKRMHEVSCERCAETFTTKESLQEHR